MQSNPAKNLLAAALLSALAFISSARAAGPLPSWNDTAPMKAIVAFVENVSKADSPDFVPVAERIAQLVKIGNTPVQFQIGARYYPERPANGPEWGLRFAITLPFPK